MGATPPFLIILKIFVRQKKARRREKKNKPGIDVSLRKIFLNHFLKKKKKITVQQKIKPPTLKEKKETLSVGMFKGPNSLRFREVPGVDVSGW